MRAGLLLKRGIDVIGAVVGLVLFSPLLIGVALAIWLTQGRPILFRQRRSGHLCRIFMVHKFRTMTNAWDAHGNLLPDSDRLSGLGRWLRKTSLDELPQFWQVLKGDMSLVGPRPLIPCYLQRYTAFQLRRHEMKPGITGWAQIQGRNSLHWEHRFELDVWYVDHWSIRLDCEIIRKTFWNVLKCQGVTHPNHVTMPEFLGTEESGAYLPAASRLRQLEAVTD